MLPPFTGVAVNVTFVPWQIEVAEATTVTDGVTTVPFIASLKMLLYCEPFTIQRYSYPFQEDGILVIWRLIVLVPEKLLLSVMLVNPLPVFCCH